MCPFGARSARFAARAERRGQRRHTPARSPPAAGRHGRRTCASGLGRRPAMERTTLDEREGNGHKVEDLKNAATARLDEAVQWSGQLLDRVEAFVRERPGTAIVAALGAGYLIGRLVRRI